MRTLFFQIDEGEIILSDYFGTKDFTEYENSVPIKRKIIYCGEKYYDCNDAEGDSAFICLSNFLYRFNRPFLHSYVWLKEFGAPDDNLFPSDLKIISYNEPQHLSVDTKGKLIYFVLNERAFDEVYRYIYGKDFGEKNSDGVFEFGVPFKYFNALMLD